MKKDMDRLEKEERLEMKRRMEISWKGKKTHYDHLIWAKELLTGPILEQVLLEGNEPERIPECQEEDVNLEGGKGNEPEEVRRARTTGGTLHLTSQVVKEILPEGRMPEGDKEPMRKRRKSVQKDGRKARNSRTRCRGWKGQGTRETSY